MTERVDRDAYLTPDGLAWAICRHVKGIIPDVTRIVEPSAGGGSFVWAARAVWPEARIVAVEIDRSRAMAAGHGEDTWIEGDWRPTARHAISEARDGATPELVREGPRPVLVLGNPPFSQAQGHIEAALKAMEDGDHLVFLLRLNFLGANCRVEFWEQTCLASVTPIAPRPSFIGGHNDSGDYGVFVWRKGYEGRAALHTPLCWSREDRRAA